MRHLPAPFRALASLVSAIALRLRNPAARRYLAWGAISFLAIAAPVLARAAHLEVPVLRPEMLILLGALLVLGGIVAFVFAESRIAVRVGMAAFLMLVSLDILVGGRSLVIGMGSGAEGMRGQAEKALMVALALGLLFVGAWLLRRHLAVVLLVYLGGFAATTLPMLTFSGGNGAAATPPRASAVARADGAAPKLPLILHIVVDEMMSPGAMTRDLPGAAEAYDRVAAFESRFGFRSYHQVYSRYNITFASLAAAFNFVASSGADMSELLEGRAPGDKQRYRLKKNALFDELEKRGYAIRVYQYDIFDFCAHHAVVRCRTQKIYHPLDRHVRAAMDAQESIVNLALDLLGRKSFAHGITDRVVGALDPDLRNIGSHYASHSWPSLIAELADVATRAPDGTALFVHLMAPHHPYVWDEDCEPVEANPFQTFGDESGRYGEGRINDETSRRARYQLYFKQVACVFDRLAVLLERLEAARRLENALILIHGDHGSRISLADPRAGDPAALTERDLVDLHAAYFAVRSPRAPHELDTERVSVQGLIARLFGPPGASAPSNTVVVLEKSDDPDGLEPPVAELPMPAFGPALSAGGGVILDNPASADTDGP